MAVEMGITVDLKKVVKDLGRIRDPDVLTRMNREIGVACTELTADHIAKNVSPTHHKTVKRLGAVASGFYEFARGREGFYQGRKRGEGEAGYIEVKDVNAEGSSVVIGNTPGMSRAFRDLEIRPKKAKELTIPIHRDSYALRVRDVKTKFAGIKIFRVTAKTGRSYLIGSEGQGKDRRTRPLYALVKSVRIPQDRGLLPELKEYEEKAAETAEVFLEMEEW